MDPMEFRILNAYRDGDMKAHRREAKNCALIECVQVAAAKAKWPIREEFQRMSSRVGDGDARPALPLAPTAAASAPSPARPQRTGYERPRMPQPPVSPPATPPPSTSGPAIATTAPPPPPPAPPPAKTQHGVARFSSVFGTRRR
jgi:hypothetical protein